MPGLSVGSPDGPGGGGGRALLAGEALLVLVLVLHCIHRTLGVQVERLSWKFTLTVFLSISLLQPFWKLCLLSTLYTGPTSLLRSSWWGSGPW